MSALGDTSVVVAAVAGATGFTIVRDIKEGKPSFKPVLGGMVLGAFLLFIAIWSLDIAKALAILILATSALVNGKIVFGIATQVANA